MTEDNNGVGRLLRWAKPETRNQKPEIRMKPQTQNPKRLRFAPLGFPSGLSLRVEDWFQAFIRISGFGFRVCPPRSFPPAPTIRHPISRISPPHTLTFKNAGV